MQDVSVKSKSSNRVQLVLSSKQREKKDFDTDHVLDYVVLIIFKKIRHDTWYNAHIIGILRYSIKYVIRNVWLMI